MPRQRHPNMSHRDHNRRATRYPLGPPQPSECHFWPRGDGCYKAVLPPGAPEWVMPCTLAHPERYDYLNIAIAGSEPRTVPELTPGTRVIECIAGPHRLCRRLGRRFSTLSAERWKRLGTCLRSVCVNARERCACCKCFTKITLAVIESWCKSLGLQPATSRASSERPPLSLKGPSHEANLTSECFVQSDA